MFRRILVGCDGGLDAYVAVDACGTFSQTKREVGLLRMLNWWTDEDRQDQDSSDSRECGAESTQNSAHPHGSVRRVSGFVLGRQYGSNGAMTEARLTIMQSKTEDFLRFWAVRCADLGFIPPPGRTALLSWKNDSPGRCYSADVGDRDIERPGQLPTDPITWFLLTVFD